MTRPQRRLNAVPDHPQRVVAYIRVSALMGRGGEDFHSPEMQLAAIRRMTSPAGMREVAVVEDIDQTGRTFNREGIDKIRAMAEKGSIDALAVYDVSRLGRNVRESLVFLLWLADHGVTILSTCEQVDTSTPVGRLMLTNMLAIAEYRSDEIGRHWSATISRRAERGHHHGVPPRGYLRVDKQLVPDPVLAPVMVKVFDDYAAGKPIGVIARELAAATSQQVWPTNLKKTLRSAVYIGMVVHKGQILPGSHEPLVDADVWRKVQDRLVRDSGTPSRTLAMSWSLAGLLFCEYGHVMWLMTYRVVNRRGVVSYDRRTACGVRVSRGTDKQCPGSGSPAVAKVEDAVVAQVAEHVRLLRTSDAAMQAAVARRAEARSDVSMLEAELARVRTGLQRLARGWALGDVDDDTYRATRAGLEESRAGLEQRIAAVQPAAVGRTPEEAVHAGEALLAVWAEASGSERNALLRLMVSRVTIRASTRYREPPADRITVEWL